MVFAPRAFLPGRMELKHGETVERAWPEAQTQRRRDFPLLLECA
jgi:hypothetical protein